MEDNNHKEVYWQNNLSVLDTFVKEITFDPDIVSPKGYRSKIIDNKKDILELPKKMEEHINLALLQYQYFFEKTEKLINNANIAIEKSNELGSLSAELANNSKELKRQMSESNTRLNSAQGKLEAAKKSLVENQNKLDESQKELSDTSEKLKNSTSEFISILGIFSALIFGVFGGFDAFKSIFENMRRTPISTTLIDGSELMIGLIVLVFLLIESISILSNKTFLACGCENTSNCSHSFYQRYPLFCLSLSIFVLVMVGGSLVHYINIHGLLYSNKYLVWVLPLIGIFIFFRICCKVYKEIGKKT